MQKLEFQIEISAAPESVWKTMWEDDKYRIWAAHFNSGTYFQLGSEGWSAGGKIRFLSGDGQDGIYSEITRFIENQEVWFKFVGMIESGKEVPLPGVSCAQTPLPADSNQEMFEIYHLKPTSNGTLLKVILDTDDEYAEFFNKIFPIAINEIKDLVESI